MLDSKQKMLELTDRRAKWIIDIFNDLRDRRRVGVKKWQ